MRGQGRRRVPVWLFVFVLIVMAGMGLLGFAYRSATADPVRRETAIALPNWPAGQAPLRIALLSDIHVAGPDMPPERLRRIVAQVNAARPELVLIAGDFTSDKRVATRLYTTAEAVAPLAGLRAPLGVYAVPGNHDHWRDIMALRRALPQVGVHLLENEAAQVGPFALLGLDDEFSGHSDVPRTLASARGKSGPRVVLTHSPDAAVAMTGRADLVLAGHTHCGQIALPFIGRLATMSRYGERFACGRVEGDRATAPTVIVGAGLGTSLLSLRLGEPPDWWLITVRG